MRLIDADALMELFDERLDGAHLQTVTRRTGKTLWSGIYGGVNWGRNTIALAPTIDAVPVVRCKDCKYRSGLMGRPPFMFYTCTCAEGLTGAVRENNFCSYGERKDGEG